jgi:hypothetical protein
MRITPEMVLSWRYDPGGDTNRKSWGILPDSVKRVNRVFFDYRENGVGEVELGIERASVEEFPDLTFSNYHAHEAMEDSWFQADRILYIQSKLNYWLRVGPAITGNWWERVILEFEMVQKPITATPTVPANIPIVPNVKPGGKPPFVNGDLSIYDPHQPPFEGPIQFPEETTPGQLPPTFVQFVTDQEIARTTNLPTVKPARRRSFLNRVLARWRKS